MNDFLKWGTQLTDDSKIYTKLLVDEALKQPTYAKGRRFLKQLKTELPSSNFGTTDQVIETLMNNVIEDALSELSRIVWNKPVDDDDRGK